MRLVVFCDEDLGLPGGSSRQVLEWVRVLGHRGHDICVVAPQPSRSFTGEQSWPKVRYRWVWAPRLSVLRSLVYLGMSGLALTWTMLRWRPDCLLWFDAPGQVSPLLAAALTGCPYLLVVNGLPDEEVSGIWKYGSVRRLLSWMLKVCARKAEGVVSVCQEIVSSMQQQWNIREDRCWVIRNGVDPDHFSPQEAVAARRRIGLGETCHYVGFVGGFFPWHGLEVLIEAVPLVLKQGMDVRFLLVGDGPMRQQLESQVIARGLQPSIRFVGRVDFEEVPRWIAACDVCVVLHRQTRSYPGDSMKLWEYLSCGRPVVTTVGPGYGETVEAIGCGLAAEPDDAQDLARQLVRLLEDPDERMKMGERGRMAVIQAHTWGARAQELEHVCSAVLAATRRTA